MPPGPGLATMPDTRPARLVLANLSSSTDRSGYWPLRRQIEPCLRQARDLESPDVAGFFASAVRPFLTRHCTDCHGENKPKAGLNLVAFQDEAKAARNRRLWTRSRRTSRGG